MMVLGLTGSIGMGKTATARALRRLGIPVHDADAAVHQMMNPGGEAVSAVEKAFPGTVSDGAVDRARLGNLVFQNPEALRRLESILHPLVFKGQEQFLRGAARRRCPVAVLDVPLLFETRTHRACDAVIVVSAPAFLQRQRVLRRPGMTAKRLEDVLACQISDWDKRRRGDFVVSTGLGHAYTLRCLRRIMGAFRRESPYRRRRKPSLVPRGMNHAGSRTRYGNDGTGSP